MILLCLQNFMIIFPQMSDYALKSIQVTNTLAYFFIAFLRL